MQRNTSQDTVELDYYTQITENILPVIDRPITLEECWIQITLLTERITNVEHQLEITKLQNEHNLLKLKTELALNKLMVRALREKDYKSTKLNKLVKK